MISTLSRLLLKTTVSSPLLERPCMLRFSHGYCQSTQLSPPSVYQVWGANTGVGKTVFSGALLHALQRPSLYLKPVQSGFPEDDDAVVVKKLAPQARALSLFNFSRPVSPDLATRSSDASLVSDNQLISGTSDILHDYLLAPMKSLKCSQVPSFALVETAGGVLTPAPSGSLQADTYRSLRLPAILVGDSKLGGISATLSAYEALRLRGYDVSAIVLFQSTEGLENEVSIQHNLEQSDTKVFLAPPLPSYPAPLSSYLRDQETSYFFVKLCNHLKHTEQIRRAYLQSLSEKAAKLFWYPFTQHSKLDKIRVFDSAYGNNIAVFDDAYATPYEMTDAMGSWWTNGVGHGNTKIAKAIANAAGRYGHVMFAGAVHEPAFLVAQRAIETVGAGWATRTFFSDNGSTAVEVALKMAFRKRANDEPQRNHLPVHIVGLRNSYHGDTLGVMDCSERSDFNVGQTPWYEPRGYFFEPPTVALRRGIWKVEVPEWLSDCQSKQMAGMDEAMDKERDLSLYKQAIGRRLDDILDSGQVDLGALLIEPVLLGAGGMKMVDVAFQRALVLECRSRKIPIVFDEVFTGFWRLGEVSGGNLIGCTPDVAAYGKLLTGGAVPLAITLASEEVFNAFRGNSKKEALLHGHSYTAHAIGCAAAVESLRVYEKELAAGKNKYWCEEDAREISSMEGVECVTMLGTVLSVEMSGTEQGYSASGAQEIVRRLAGEQVFTRALGNVVYLMCTPLTSSSECKQLTHKLMRVLDTAGSKGAAHFRTVE